MVPIRQTSLRQVQSAVSQPRFYRPELDLLRLLAFTMVFLHHTPAEYVAWSPLLTQINHACASGVQLFFVLSSYLITELLLREREKTGSVHVQAFFMRRILRIWPLYFCFIGACLLITHLTHFVIFPTSAAVAFLLLAGNWWVAAHGFLSTVGGPLWSISLEEQYYLLWPFVARFGSRLGLWIASIGFLVCALLTLGYFGHSLAPRYAVWSNSFVEFEFFAVGAILALLLHGRNVQPPVWTRPLLMGSAALLLGLAGSYFKVIVGSGGVPARQLLSGYGCLTLAIVAIFLAFFGATVSSWAKPLEFLGRISYGLYVFHDLSIRMVYRTVYPRLASLLARHNAPSGLMYLPLTLGSLLLCIVLAWLSYRYLEAPFLHLKVRFTFVRSQREPNGWSKATGPRTTQPRGGRSHAYPASSAAGERTATSR